MIYEIWITNKEGFSDNIYDPAYEENKKAVIKPRLSMEMNKPGSLEFTLPPSNIGYHKISYYTTIVDVVEDGRVIWTGRIVETSVDFYNRMTVRCEGALAFLNDIALEYHEYKQITADQFFGTVIQRYNEAVMMDGLMFDGGEVSPDSFIEERLLWRCTDYDTAWDCLDTMLLQSEGGWYFLSKSSPGNIPIKIEYKQDFEEEQLQTIELTKNITAFTRGHNAKEIVTEIWPVCHYNDTVYTINHPNVPDSENQKHYILPDHVSLTGTDSFINEKLMQKYGRRMKVLEFDMVENLNDEKRINELQSKLDAGIIESEESEELANSIIENNRIICATQGYMAQTAATKAAELEYAELVVDLTAADLKYLKKEEDINIDAFELGKLVHIISEPHNFDKVLPIYKMQINLDTAAKQITIGVPPRRTLTEIFDPKKKP